jgi:hypothetical protein
VHPASMPVFNCYAPALLTGASQDRCALLASGPSLRLRS